MEARGRGAGGDGPRHHARLSRRHGRAGLQGNRAAAASQSRPDGRGRPREAAQVVGLDGHHAGDGGGPAERTRRAALRRARQGAGAQARDHQGGGRGQGALHQRHPDRHRRNPRRADRGAAGLARAAPGARPSAGSHHPELPRQARHAHGQCARAVVRRAAVDGGGRAPDLRRHALGPGAAQPAGAGLWPADRGRHRRLGRRVAGDARPRESRTAVAADRGAGGRERPARQGADRAAGGLSALRPGQELDRSGAAPARAGDERGERPAPRQRLAARPGDEAAAGRHRHAGTAGGAAERQPRAHPRSRGARRRSRRGRHRPPVRRPRRRFCRRHARGRCAAHEVVGDTVSYAVVRNINYTNICYFRCGFCAFSKGKLAANLRGSPYDLTTQEIVRRATEAWERGATEVCMQGGIHPEYTGNHYLEVCRAVREAVPGMHVHAFSPLEVWHGATTLKRSIPDYLAELREAGLGSLPGTAAEILDDEVRDVLCPDKVSTEQWLVDHARRPRRRPALDRHHHVRPCRAAGALGAPPVARPQPAEGHRRLHRAGAAALRRRRGADRAQGPGAHGADLPRSRADAFDRPAGAASAHQEHPDVVGEDGRRGRPASACRPAPTISAAP